MNQHDAENQLGKRLAIGFAAFFVDDHRNAGDSAGLNLKNTVEPEVTELCNHIYRV